MRNFLLESLKNRDGLTNVCCSALWMLMGSDIAFAMTFAVKAGDKELFCSKTIYSCLFLKKANKKPTKQQKLFTVYYQPNWIVIFRRVSMLNSETEFEECVPIILDLDAVSPLNSKSVTKGVFSKSTLIVLKLKMSKQTWAFRRYLLSRSLQPSLL